MCSYYQMAATTLCQTKNGQLLDGHSKHKEICFERLSNSVCVGCNLEFLKVLPKNQIFDQNDQTLRTQNLANFINKN
jgi:hypothetical protein